MGDLPSWSFDANHGAMRLKMFGHNLARRFARTVVPVLANARWRIQWLRRALIAVAGQLVKSGRRWHGRSTHK